MVSKEGRVKKMVSDIEEIQDVELSSLPFLFKLDYFVTSDPR